jgi:hypothetical protein
MRGQKKMRGQPWTLDIRQDVPEVSKGIGREFSFEKRGRKIVKTLSNVRG